jgi:transcriptional regulator with XRE-family HTH domain
VFVLKESIDLSFQQITALPVFQIMKFHNLKMTDPEWDAFLQSIIGVDPASIKRLAEDQSMFFGTRKYFGGLPATWFRTVAGGMLQELISKCENDKKLVARRAGMSATNLYAILYGKHDPKLGTLLRLVHANGYEFKFELVKQSDDAS